MNRDSKDHPQKCFDSSFPKINLFLQFLGFYSEMKLMGQVKVNALVHQRIENDDAYFLERFLERGPATGLMTAGGEFDGLCFGWYFDRRIGGPFSASVSGTTSYPAGMLSSSSVRSVEVPTPYSFLWSARICKSALNGDRQIGQALDWNRRFSAHKLHKHKCRHGRMMVSRCSFMQTIQSPPVSSQSSSPESYWKIPTTGSKDCKSCNQ